MPLALPREHLKMHPAQIEGNVCDGNHNGECFKSLPGLSKGAILGVNEEENHYAGH